MRNIRSRTSPFWRTSWYRRCPCTTPVPSASRRRRVGAGRLAVDRDPEAHRLAARSQHQVQVAGVEADRRSAPGAAFSFALCRATVQLPSSDQC